MSGTVKANYSVKVNFIVCKLAVPGFGYIAPVSCSYLVSGVRSAIICFLFVARGSAIPSRMEWFGSVSKIGSIDIVVDVEMPIPLERKRRYTHRRESNVRLRSRDSIQAND